LTNAPHRALLDAQNLTLDALRAKDPALADQVHTLIRQAELARLEPSLVDLPDDVRAKVASVDLTRTTGDVVAHLRVKLVELGVDPEYVERVVQKAHSAKLGKSLPPGQPVGSAVAVAQQLAASNLQEVTTLAGLPGPAASAVAKAASTTSALDDTTITTLVTSKALTEAQGQALGFSVALYELTDQSSALAKAIQSASLPQLGGKPAASTADLAKVDPAGWTTFLASASAALPAGVTPQIAGVALARRFATVEPNAAVFGRLPAASTSDTKMLSNAYSGLGLAAVLDDPKSDAATKASTVSRRVGLVQQVGAQLGATALLQLDLSQGSADLAKLGLDKLGATADEQTMVLATLKAYQRVWIVAKDIDLMHTVVQAGFSSALSIAKLPLASFVAQSGFSAGVAQAVWEGARTSMADVSLAAGAIVDHTSAVFTSRPYSNQAPSAAQYLAQLPGYQDLFGSLSFCDCQECASILGPAAYFVDLMKFIDDNLRNQAMPPTLDLKTRRPDLWTLELSCDNTNNRIATLDIVDEVLETYIATQVNPNASVYEVTLLQANSSFEQPFCLPLARIASYLPALGSTRAAVADAVGASPVARAQAELDLSAQELGIVTTPTTTLATLSRWYKGLAFVASGAGIAQVDAAQLGPAMDVTRTELGQIVDAVFVAAGGASVTIVSGRRNANSIQNDVEWVTGLTVDALDRMHRFTCMVRKTGWAPPDLDLVLATLGDTTLASAGVVNIGQLHALQGRFGLSIGDLCALVGPIPQTPKTPPGTSLFDQLFNAPSNVTLSGAFPEPTTRFFHPAFLQGVDTSQPADPTNKATSPTLAKSLAQTVPRVLSGLGVELGGLEALVRGLAAHLAQESSPGFDPDAGSTGHAGTADQRYFVLSIGNLSLLYRHARLARLLRLSVQDLFQLFGLLGLDHVGALADLETVLDLWTWWQPSGYSLDDVAVATGGVARDPTAYLDPVLVAQNIVQAAAKALTFADTVFCTGLRSRGDASVALGTTEQGSLDLLTNLSANAPTGPQHPTSTPLLVQQSATDGSWSLVAGVDLSPGSVTMTIPPTATVSLPATATSSATTTPVTPQEVLDALQPYLASEVLKRGLGTAFNITTDRVDALAALAGQSLTADAVAKVVRGALESNPPPLDALVNLVTALIPLAVAFAAPTWKAPPPPADGSTPPPAPIDFVHATPSLFGQGKLPQTSASGVPCVSLVELRALSIYGRLTQRQLSASPPGNPADLQRVLTTFDPATSTFSTAVDATAALARVLGVPVGVVVGLRGPLTLPAIAAPALDLVDRAAQLAVTLGIDGATLGGLVSNQYDALSSAADALVLALGTRYTDPTTRAAKLDAAEQPVREAKRDALADYLVTAHVPAVWHSLDDLYQYFLIDVSAGGCSTTSRVVSATMSAQLYVYRAMMNLERDPQGDVVVLPADAAAEWEWRKNYRVWQANREVFLWPENYLDPDLRDDMTPLFQDLQSQLLQTDITDQDVLDAYVKYMTGFEELASLTVAGAYHDVQETMGYVLDDLRPGRPRPGGPGFQPQVVSDVFHLFGVTSKDPLRFYYRTCQNLIASGSDPRTIALWSPWQPISVQISGRKVSPVVFKGRLHVFWTDIKTKPQNQIQGGSSQFVGYSHTMTARYTTLRPDETWDPPQKVQLPVGMPEFGPSGGEVLDSVVTGAATLDPLQRSVSSPPSAIDDYTLSGASWDWVWFDAQSPSKLGMQLRNFHAQVSVDLFLQNATWATPGPASRAPRLLCAEPEATGGVGTGQRILATTTIAYTHGYLSATANLIIDSTRMDEYERETPIAERNQLYKQHDLLANIPSDTEFLAIPGSEEDAILQMGSDMLLMQGSVTNDDTYVLRRLGTALVDPRYPAEEQEPGRDLARRLIQDGLDAMLDTQTQFALVEAFPSIFLLANIQDRSRATWLDTYGVYYQELFFHIPFLIANALSSRGNFEAAQKWYRYIFDPTCSDQMKVTFAGLTTAQVSDPAVGDSSVVPWGDVPHRVLDRVWRYDAFRRLDAPKLRDILTDPTTIALYKSDPFSPWAIARGRISAFQKAIVMKYVDNLLDWGDSLFSQFTMESVNEALMLYIMASDILGPRPTDVGDCGTGIEPDTYEKIGPLLDGSNDFLIELEGWTASWRVPSLVASAGVITKYTPPRSGLVHAVQGAPLFSVAPPSPAVSASPGAGTTAAPAPTPAPAATAAAPSAESTGVFIGLGWDRVRTASWGPALGSATTKTPDKTGGRTFDNGLKAGFGSRIGRFAYSAVRQMGPAFCVPVDPDLLARWDRVEDRLYKIRHCMNIDGELQQLALFAPPINPMQLVAMKAAGLSLDDVLGASNGDLPPYRFLYLIERAKALASTVSGFGASLLSALEKKDGEELNRLRLSQQMNLAQATRQTRQLEIDAASATVDVITQQLTSAQYRGAYYAGLISGSLSQSETSAGKHFDDAVGYYQGGQLSLLGAAVAYLFPEVGSPFAMVFGGREVGAAFSAGSQALGMQAAISGVQASSSSLSAGFDRRSDGWKNQKQLADYDVLALTKQQTAAQIRLSIANAALDLHDQSIEQIQEFLDRTDGKFTNLGLYTWLSGSLQTLYRGAYQNALSLAKLAELAFRFERGDYTSPGLNLGAYWDPTHAGLLAGERLLIDLQTLERRFIETNYRTLEIDQAFALSQVDPQALIDLRETGECTFTVREVFFDLFYPGHYKRRIKAVRLTIPCITGPYVNVSASLDLVGSQIRTTPTADLVAVPPTRSVSIATSTAQNDAGVFELSFRDERYMPFEGLGAVESQWHLTLPKTFRQFDYQTINDVILSMSYIAEQDGVLRQQIEDQLGQAERSIASVLASKPAQRLFSLRQDFSSAFTRLLRSPVGTPVAIELTERSFPFFLRGALSRGATLKVTKAVLILRTGAAGSSTGFKMTIGGTALPAFTVDTSSYDGLPYVDSLATAFGNLGNSISSAGNAKYALVVSDPGGLAPTAPAPGDVSSVDPTKLHDVLLYLEYTL
jgi:hypothetical protein